MTIYKRQSVMLLMILLWALAEDTALAEKSNQPNEEETARWTFVPLPVLSFSSDTGFMVGIYPNIFYNPDTSNPDQKSNSISFLGIYTEKQQWTMSGATDWFFDVDRYNLKFSTEVSRYPSSFYGIGPGTDLDDSESYTPLRFDLATAFRFKIVSGLYLGPRVLFTSIDMVEVENGEMLDTGNIPGSDGATFLGGGPSLTWDKRDNGTYPHSGFIADVKLDFFRKELGSSENYTQLALDYRHFFQLYGEHVLGVELYSRLTHGTVPFQVLPHLGGSSLMRGYFNARFRDMVSVATQIEYRFPIYWRFGGVVFAGVGQVAPRLSELSVDDLKYATGFGIRFAFVEDPKVNVRIDFAFSPESFDFHIKALEAF